MAIYNGRNNLPAKQMITERARYSVRALTLLDRVNDLTLETNQIKDLNLDERIFIGRIDENNNPLFVKQRLLQSFGNPTPSKVGLNFVVDAFTDMKAKFDRDLALGNINRNAPALTELVVKKSYINPFDSYGRLLDARIQQFKNYVISNNALKRIHNFESFADVFMEYVEDTAASLPITRSMYFLTRDYSPLNSGLALEIDNAPYDVDQYKADAYLSQRNFEYFKNLASSYGFIIDKNIPWRLIADLNSPQMTPYIENTFGFAGGSNYVLAVAFTQTYNDDIPSIADMMTKFYNSIVEYRFRTVVKEPGATTTQHSAKTVFNKCSTKTKIITRKKVNPVKLPTSYDDSWWLDKYIRIRNIESELNYSETVLNNIIENATDLVKRVDRGSAMSYTISKFDNVEHFNGSTFYDVTRLDFAEEGLGLESDVKETVQRSVQASNFVVY
jgi:hypothetical protein